MTNSEQVSQLGNNAYGKPAAALNILRETVLGRELFDYAFKMYSNRWKFKHPAPSDFFRTMEDASGVDLDWFWRGWFYTTDHVDIELANLRYKRMDPRDPLLAEKLKREDKAREVPDLSRQRNIESGLEFVVDKDPATRDFYNSFDPLTAIRNAVAPVPIGDPQGDFVRLRAQELSADWARIADRDPAGTAIVHGDLHEGNVLRTAAGALLTDLELARARSAAGTSPHHEPRAIGVARNMTFVATYIGCRTTA